jgi:hypothetical protein
VSAASTRVCSGKPGPPWLSTHVFPCWVTSNQKREIPALPTTAPGRGKLYHSAEWFENVVPTLLNWPHGASATEQFLHGWPDWSAQRRLTAASLSGSRFQNYRAGG